MAISIYTGERIDEENPYYTEATGQVSRINPYYEYAKSPTQSIDDDMTQAVDNADWDANDTLMAARAFIDGLWLNKAEEIGSWPAAVSAKILNPSLFEGKSITEIRNEMLSDLEAESAQFREERPAVSIGANIAGSVFSPVSLKGTQIVGDLAKLRQGQQAIQAQQAATTATRGATAAAEQAANATRTAQAYAGMSPQMYNVVTKTPVPFMYSGLAATEGAVIGAEGNTPEEIAANAAQTAAIGAVIPFGIEGIKRGYNFATQTQLAQQLGRGEDFLPLVFTNHGLQGVYQHLVSKAFFGKTMIEQQVRGVVARMPSVGSAKEAVKISKDNAKAALSRTQAAITRDKEAALREAMDVRDMKLLAIKNNKTLSDAAKKEESDAVIREFEDLANAEAGQVKATLLKDADAHVNMVETQTRDMLWKEAMPSIPRGADDMVDSLLTMDPQDRLTALRNMWKDHGFGSAKAQSFKMDVAGFQKQLKELFDKDSDLIMAMAQSGNNFNTVMKAIATDLKNVADGVIDGKAIVQLRSNIGSIANALPPDSKGKAIKYIKEVQALVDDVIESQLKGKDLAAWKRDKATWGSFKTLEEAVYKATGGKRQVQGQFTLEDYIDAAKSNNKWAAAAGEATPLQREVQETLNMMRVRDGMLRKQADESAAEIIARGKKSALSQKQAAAKAKAAATVAYNKEVAEINAAYNKSARTAQDLAAKQDKLAQVKAKHKAQLDEADNIIITAERNLEALNKMKSRENVSLFEQGFSTGVIGNLMGGIGAGAEQLAAGALGAAGLATQRGQRLLAGQSRLQEAARGVSRRAEEIGQTQLPSVGVGTRRLDAKVGELSNVSGLSAGAAGEGERPKMVLGDDMRKAVVKMSDARKANVMEGIIRRGQAEALKAQDPKTYKLLMDAYNKRR